MKIVPLSLLAILTFAGASAAQAAAASLSVADYPSIQEAIDKNPGKVLQVPDGDYQISKVLKITSPHSGLCGPGRIIQNTPTENIIRIDGAEDVQLRDITLLRPEGKTDTLLSGITASKSPSLVLDNVSVLENRTRGSAIIVNECDYAQIRNILVKDYMCIAEEDRTDKGDYWGFSFMTLNGTGIDIRGSVGVLLEGSRFLEFNFKPTQELKEKYGLGKFVKVKFRGTRVDQQMWDQKYYNAWHQGAAVHLGNPETGDYTRVLGNYIENAAQGIDVQNDHVIVANNIVNNAFIGMKAVHGSRNLILVNNQFSKDDLWSINVSPGAASHLAGTKDKKTGATAGANIDGHSIIANNIVSDFGYGSAYFMWKDSTRYPIRFEKGPLPEDPALNDLIVEGNIVYDTGKDQILVDGKPQVEPPRYQWAIFVDQTPAGPKGVHFYNNLLDPGTTGASNVELKP